MTKHLSPVGEADRFPRMSWRYARGMSTFHWTTPPLHWIPATPMPPIR